MYAASVFIGLPKYAILNCDVKAVWATGNACGSYMTFGKPQRRACQLSRSLQILTEERTTHEQSTEAVTLTGKRLQD